MLNRKETSPKNKYQIIYLNCTVYSLSAIYKFWGVSHSRYCTLFQKSDHTNWMPDIPFQDLRHSCAVFGLQTEVPVKSVQEQPGHYSSAFTMDVYASVSETMMDDTRAKAEKIIKVATR